ncbi:MAG: type II secretion system F family protein, partial [Gemmatimonadota bacterium]
MATFTYSARTSSGDLQAGELALKSRDEVVQYLRRQRMVPIKIEQKSQQLTIPRFGKGIGNREIVIFARQFATMINSGLPLVQSLDILAKQSENAILRKVIEQVQYDVESGHTLADAMRQHPQVFSDLFVNMVAAGEAGGILDTILLRLAVFLEKADAL